MYSELTKKTVSSIVSIALILQTITTNVYAVNPNTATRLDWNMIETNTSASSLPSNVKYFKYYDVMPDDITLPVYKDMDLSTVSGKKLFVGYGTVDPDGNSCRYFPELGRTECLPWWRVEREYSVPDTNSTSATDFIKNLTMLYPPKNIQYCKAWKSNEQLSGGMVTCTSYYDKRKSVDCLANPEQSACYVDECSDGIKTACTLIGTETGQTTTLQRPMVGDTGLPVGMNMVVGLKTSQYQCPSGYMPRKECADWLYGVTYPFECKAPSSVQSNDGEYIYCDTNPQPYYDNSGALTGFTSNDRCTNGTLMDGSMGTNGKQNMCPVNNFSQTQKVCDDPIIQVESSIANQTINQKRTFKDYETSVLFGDEVGDIYAGDPMCLRLNTVEGARQKNMSVHIYGSGSLDDDIYVIAHKSNGSYNKVYCNMQHNQNSLGTAKKWIYNFSGFNSIGTKTITATLTMDTGETSLVSKVIQVVNNGGMNNAGVDISAAGSMSVDKNISLNFSVFSGASIVSVVFNMGDSILRTATLDSSTASMVNKNYAGDTLQCIENNGNYSFDKMVSIVSSDVVSIQQASEAEYVTHEHLFSRAHYRSTAVTIDNVLAAPPTFPANYPTYPLTQGLFLQTWDNALSTFSLMFPFAGSYEVFVYGGSSEGENKILGSATLTVDDFKSMPNNGYIQLKMGKAMSLAAGMNDGDKSEACREDDFVEWGGGVYGSLKGSKGDMVGCSSPNDAFVKSNKAYNIVVKDLLTGSITPIRLVYPLPYPNRIFVSKLNVLEDRKYRCYDDFPNIASGNGCIIGAQNESSPVSDYRGHSVNMNRSTTLYCDVASEKIIGCRNEHTIQRDGGIVYENSDQYETINNSGMFMNALAGAQLSEQMMHIWSGWHGECEHGIFTDFSWTSDPMTLASLAMSAYASATASAGNASAAAADEADAASEVAQLSDAAQIAAATGDAVAMDAIAEQLATATQKLADATAKAEYWAQSLGNELTQIVDKTTASVTNEFTSMAKNAEEAVSKMISGATSNSESLAELAKDYNAVVEYGSTVYNNTINITETTAKLDKYMSDLTKSYLEATAEGNTVAAEIIQAEIEATANQLSELMNTLPGQLLESAQSTTTTVKNLFVDPATSQIAKDTAQNSAFTELTQSMQTQVKDFMNRLDEYNKIADVGFTTIKWSQIAQAGYQMYSNVAASRDDMIKAWKAQQAYVLSGQGTSNDIAANAYASCMASMGTGFVNSISIAMGAKDSNATSQELLTPWHNPMRISLQSLYELRQIVGDDFMQMSYRIMDLDYNMQMTTIVALNSAAYTQLTQLVCGGYNVATLANALNQSASKKPSMIDGLKNMSPEQAAKMAASVACTFAGPYAFACSLGMKVLSSVSSGNACTDEKIAMSQKPIQLKTNKFQKFDQCHHVSSSCSRKLFGMGCVLKKEHYCCYDQIMTRIFAEGVKEQRGTGWGSCNDITINDLKDISFTPCAPGQDPHINKCFPLGKYNELTGVLKKQIKKGFATDGDTFMRQVQNAMEVSQ